MGVESIASPPFPDLRCGQPASIPLVSVLVYDIVGGALPVYLYALDNSGYVDGDDEHFVANVVSKVKGHGSPFLGIGCRILCG